MSINSSTTSPSHRSEMGHVLDAGFRYLNHIYTAQISREPELDGLHDLLYSYDNDFSVVRQATIKNRRLLSSCGRNWTTTISNPSNSGSRLSCDVFII